jgi:hypothetical protein
MRSFVLQPGTAQAVARIGTAVCCLVAGLSASAGRNPVPATFQGAWVPAKAACDSPVRVQIAADQVTLVQGNDREALGDIEMAGPGFWGRDYRGIMAVLLTEFGGQQPATITFNVGEKLGAAQIEFSPVLKGNANAQMKAYNARITKLKLAKRFALDKVVLKRCGGG